MLAVTIIVVMLFLSRDVKSNDIPNNSLPLANHIDGQAALDESPGKNQHNTTTITTGVILREESITDSPNIPAVSTDSRADTPTDSDSKTEKPGTSYKEYFSNCVFIGDSITEGLSSYELIDDSNVAANKGYTVLKAKKDMNSLVNGKFHKIFILLGSNDLLYGISSSQFTEDYSEFLSLLKIKMPEAKIYVQSIFPVAAKVEQQKPMMKNSRIEEFNAALKNMSREQGVVFLDVNSILKDDSGCMRKEYSSDGIHLNYKAYKLWLDYLMKGV